MRLSHLIISLSLLTTIFTPQTNAFTSPSQNISPAQAKDYLSPEDLNRTFKILIKVQNLILKMNPLERDFNDSISLPDLLDSIEKAGHILRSQNLRSLNSEELTYLARELIICSTLVSQSIEKKNPVPPLPLKD